MITELALKMVVEPLVGHIAKEGAEYVAKKIKQSHKKRQGEASLLDAIKLAEDKKDTTKLMEDINKWLNK